MRCEAIYSGTALLPTSRGQVRARDAGAPTDQWRTSSLVRAALSSICRARHSLSAAFRPPNPRPAGKRDRACVRVGVCLHVGGRSTRACGCVRVFERVYVCGWVCASARVCACVRVNVWVSV